MSILHRWRFLNLPGLPYYSLCTLITKTSLVSALVKLARTTYNNIYDNGRFPFISQSSLSKLNKLFYEFIFSVDFLFRISYHSKLLTFPFMFSDLSLNAESKSGCSAPGNTSLALCVTEEISSLSYYTPRFCNTSQNESCLPSAALDCCIHTSFVTPINPALSPTLNCLADCYPH